MEVIPGLHMFKGPGNHYVVMEEKTVMIDVGGRRNIGRLSYMLGRIDCSFEDIKELVVTHYHFDHAGCLNGLKNATDAVVSVGKRDALYIAGDKDPEPPRGVTALGKIQLKIPWMLALYQKYPGANPDRYLSEGDVIDCLGGLEVIDTPGHTPGHICLFSREKSLMFIGDALFHFFHRLSLPFRDYTTDEEQARESLKKLVKYDFEIACFGHGPPILEDASKKIRRFVKSHKL